MASGCGSAYLTAVSAASFGTPPPGCGHAFSACPTTLLTPSTGETWHLYYYAAGQRIATRVLTSTRSSLYYLLGDHLSSTSATLNAVAQARARADDHAVKRLGDGVPLLLAVEDHGIALWRGSSCWRG